MGGQVPSRWNGVVCPFCYGEFAHEGACSDERCGCEWRKRCTPCRAGNHVICNHLKPGCYCECHYDPFPEYKSEQVRGRDDV